jgi:hypothetical protein
VSEHSTFRQTDRGWQQQQSNKDRPAPATKSLSCKSLDAKNDILWDSIRELDQALEQGSLHGSKRVGFCMDSSSPNLEKTSLRRVDPLNLRSALKRSSKFSLPKRLQDMPPRSEKELIDDYEKIIKEFNESFTFDFSSPTRTTKAQTMHKSMPSLRYEIKAVREEAPKALTSLSIKRQGAPDVWFL